MVQPAPERWTPPSWDAVVRDHGARVYRLAYRLTGNKQDAEDLTQETFVRVFRSERLWVEVTALEIEANEETNAGAPFTEEWRLLQDYVRQFGEVPPLNA